jgi:hypothetical protein
LITGTQDFFGPTMTTIVALTPTLIVDGETVYTAVLTNGNELVLDVDLYVASQSFYQPTVSPGSMSVLPDAWSNGEIVFSHSLAASISLGPTIYLDDDTIYSATVSEGDSTTELMAALWENAQAFYLSRIGIFTYDPERTLTIQLEDRVLAIALEDRALTIGFENRTLEV